MGIGGHTQHQGRRILTIARPSVVDLGPAQIYQADLLPDEMHPVILRNPLPKAWGHQQWSIVANTDEPSTQRCLPPTPPLLLRRKSGRPLGEDVQAQRFNDDGKNMKALISAKLNGHPVVERLKVNAPAPPVHKGPEVPENPIWFEAFGPRVRCRNI
jgi:hypothetical protein